MFEPLAPHVRRGMPVHLLALPALGGVLSPGYSPQACWCRRGLRRLGLELAVGFDASHAVCVVLADARYPVGVLLLALRKVRPDLEDNISPFAVAIILAVAFTVSERGLWARESTVLRLALPRFNLLKQLGHQGGEHPPGPFQLLSRLIWFSSGECRY